MQICGQFNHPRPSEEQLYLANGQHNTLLNLYRETADEKILLLPQNAGSPTTSTDASTTKILRESKRTSNNKNGLTMSKKKCKQTK
jgi:hypothetical protein